MTLPPINIQDYTYDLPEDRIANYPLAKRDDSKLLVYNKGKIGHEKFSQLTDFLPDNASLFFNNTKVIPARFYFEKETGAIIEVFLLQPVSPSSLMVTALSSAHSTTWKCAIGNLKKWTEGTTLTKVIGSLVLHAKLTDRHDGLVELTWDPSNLTFADVIHAAGAMPLPPYIKRAADQSDSERYQTVYSSTEGAVAAPTAGLHFTDEVMEKLRSRGFLMDFLTLHVSAGTFLPVKVPNAVDHSMHTEQVIVSARNVENMLLSERQIIAVGTTALRTLESLYWFGVKLLADSQAAFVIEKLDPYTLKANATSAEEALQAVLRYMKARNLDEVVGQTSIFIFPGYSFRLCKGLITNFHQPASTLLLLIAALVGSDWSKLYDEAMKNDYRFLSYGDSSLLLP